MRAQHLETSQQVRDLIATIDIFDFLDQMPDFVVVCDLDGIVLHLNRSSTRIDTAEVKGIPIYETVRPQDQYRIVQAMKRAAATGRVQRVEGVSAFSDDVFEGSIAPLYDEDHRVVGFIDISRNITQARRLEQRLSESIANEQRLNQKLRRIDAIRSELVAKVAHDLRTPITAVYGFAQTLQYRWDQLSDEDRMSMIDLVASGAERLHQLVSDTLEVSHIESDEFAVTVEPFDIVEASSNLCAELNGIPPMGRIEFAVYGEVPLVAGDQVRYDRILTNLIGNAMKYSEPETKVRVTVVREGSRAAVRIHDDGIGIADEDVPLLFRKFSQVGTSADTSTGTGLGLYITKALVEAQHGTIDVESVLGEGTTMIVRLPLADDSGAPPPVRLS